MKRTLTWILLIGSLALVVFVIYTFRNKQTTTPEPWSHVVSEATLIIEINDFNKGKDYLKSVNQFWSGDLVSLLKGLKNFQEKSASTLFCVNENSSSILLIYPLTESNEPLDLKSALQLILDEKIKSETTYNDTPILISSSSFSCIVDQCLIITNKQAWIESVIDHPQKESAPLPITSIAERAKSDNAIVFYGKWNNNEWMQLEPHASTDAQWYYTGAIFTADSSATRFSSVINSSPKRVADYLPGGALSAEVWTFDTFDQLSQHHNRMIKNKEELKYWDIALKNAGDSCNCDVNEALLSWRGGLQGTMIYTLEDLEIPVAFVDVIDSLEIATFLAPITTPVADGILAFNDPTIARRHLNSNFLVEPVYIIQAGNGAYISENPDALTFIKLDIENNNTLQRSENLNQWIDADQSFLHYYNGTYLSSIFPQSLQWFTQRSDESGGNISFQSHGVYIFDWFEGKAIEQPNEHSVVTSPIVSGNDVTLPPVAETNIWQVKNHNTGELETFTQLQDNSIILKSASGAVLWQAALPDQIVGDITQVDIYKNNKLQMAFATKKAIYIIDRNGKALANFPVKLRSEVTTGLSVFDYENDKNYRFLVGCINGDILNYSSNGQKTPGWKYASGATPKSITYNKEGNKDQIIITYQTGEERTYKRNGTR